MPLGRLHDLLLEMRLVRRTGRQIVATARGRKLLAEPAALPDDCATAVLAGETFDVTVNELARAGRLLTPVGHVALHVGLRARALAPAKRI